MAAKKFYAVVAGYEPGIYDNWPEAQAQVKGFAGAVYKGFEGRAEAEAWLKKPEYGRKKEKSATGKKELVAPAEAGEGEIVIYTDGGSINNPGPGGYGVVMIHDGRRLEFSGGFRLTTNNRMELMGCIVALRQLKERDKRIRLYSDSSYVVNGIAKGWAKNWRRKGWIKSDGKPAINPDLWAELLGLIEGLDITFNWVRGHAGNPENERCDELAVAAAREKNLPVDKGYRGEGEGIPRKFF
ncbi:MAG: ribonuclease HI [Pseudomonadota bacterium]